MRNILGILVRDSETGEVSVVPVRDANYIKPDSNADRSGKIVKQPTPEDVAISKEREEDYTLDGRLKKVSEKEL